jgi:hypothetical protein
MTRACLLSIIATASAAASSGRQRMETSAVFNFSARRAASRRSPALKCSSSMSRRALKR